MRFAVAGIYDLCRGSTPILTWVPWTARSTARGRNVSTILRQLWLLKTPKGRESLEIFAPPPYRRGLNHNSFRPRFPALVPCSQPRLTGVRKALQRGH